MKILLIGLGSIGRKHLSCFLNIKDVECAAYRTGKGQIKENTSIKTFFNIEDAIAYLPDGVIITNPTALHAKTALLFLKRNIKVLIEKPIDKNIEATNILIPYAHLIRVAYCMRFLPVNTFLREKFKAEMPFKISFKRSFYLPKWHPYADYRMEYTAKKELGGGVIRTLSHEIDLMIHWLGVPKNVIGITDKISGLEIDTDDFAFFSAKMESGARVNFELDFFSPQNVNIGEAFTTKGKYNWDINSIWFTPYNEIDAIKINSDIADPVGIMYQYQSEAFVNFIKGKHDLITTFAESLEVLKIIESIDE